VCIREHLSGAFPIRNVLKQRSVLSPLFLNFALGCTIEKAKESQTALELIETHHLVVCADRVN
jgi:hypothetical protein